MNKKCIIITTINDPTEAIIKFSNMKDIDLIIVADNKTNIANYENINCILLTLEKQKKFFPDFDKILPKNHYCRKNMGYLYAIKNNYDIIYDTDDDNIPNDNWLEMFELNKDIFQISGDKFINIYKYFTNKNIWPRGFPLTKINQNTTYNINTNKNIDDIAIIQGLVDGDPDVDAIFRLTSQEFNKNFKFNSENNNIYKLEKKTYCPANTQNTIWIDKSLFYLLYIPSFVNFRFCDIIKMYIAQKFLHHFNKKLSFVKPYVYQNRNEHNLFKDFVDEIDMYLNIEKLIDILEDFNIKNKDDMIDLFENLFEEKIIKNKDELDLLKIWFKYIKEF